MKTPVQDRPHSCSWEELFFCVVVKTLSYFSFERERLLVTQAEAGSIMGECAEAGQGPSVLLCYPLERTCPWIVTGTATTAVPWQIRASTLPGPGEDRGLAEAPLCCTPKVASVSAFPFVTQELEWRILLFIVKVKQVVHEAAFIYIVFGMEGPF